MKRKKVREINDFNAGCETNRRLIPSDPSLSSIKRKPKDCRSLWNLPLQSEHKAQREVLPAVTQDIPGISQAPQRRDKDAATSSWTG